MKRAFYLSFLVAVLLSAAAFGQVASFNSGFITSTQCVTIPATNLSTGGYGISGSWTGTLQAYGIVGQAAPQSLGTQSANGSFTVSISGFNLFEVCGNTVATGAAFVQLTTSAVGGGGGGSGLPAGCTGTTGQITCSLFTATNTVTAAAFNTTNQNGGFVDALGNGSQAGFAVGNAGQYGDSTLLCLHNVVNLLDQGCELSSGLFVPSIDRSIGITTAAMTAQSSATLTPITNMTWNLIASKNYSGWCEVPITFAASATVAFGLVGPGTPTSYNIDAYGAIGAASAYDDISLQAQTTWATTKTAASGAPATTTIAHVNFQIQNGTTAGVLTLDTAANGTNTITIGANATCHVMQLN